MATRNWTCPFCNRPQTITDGQLSIRNSWIRLVEHRHGNIGLRSIAYACANQQCKEVTLSVEFTSGIGTHDDYKSQIVLETFHLRPQSSAKPQPDFIPIALREDYAEACRIRDLSPKASATLIRRCLQGMIRDFCGISKPTLFAEIEALREQLNDGSAPRGVTYESVEAINAVRSVGNIGAHMESDVNLIVDIEPGEAQILIELVEMLFEEWYVERQSRALKLANIKTLSEAKAKLIEDGKKERLGSAYTKFKDAQREASEPNPSDPEPAGDS